MAEKKEQTKAVVTVETAMAAYAKPDLDLIKNTVAKGATDDELRLFLYTAQARGLNPLTRQIHLVKRKQKIDGEDKSVATIQTGIDGFRLIAQRTGQYAPSPKPTHFEYRGNWLVSATVYGVKLIGGHAFEFAATAHRSEYEVPYSPLWKKMPHTMLEKCAEAKMLRRGFPEELSGLYSDDEMAQADTPAGDAAAPEPLVTHNAEGDKVVEGEFKDITGTPEAGEVGTPVDSENPYMGLLLKCPDHDEEWRTNQFGKLYHRHEGNFCNFSSCPGIKEALKARAILAEMTPQQVAVHCKKRYGEPWSKLSPENAVSLIWDMDKIAEKKKDPVVKAAIEAGGEIVLDDVQPQMPDDVPPDGVEEMPK